MDKKPGVSIGDKAPNFTLPNAKGENKTLYELLEKGPVILSFYRGGWCPYCNDQLQAYQEALPEFKSRGAQLVAVSPETPKSAAETVMANELEFNVLSDTGNQVARNYDLIWTIPSDNFAQFSDWLSKTTGKTLAEYNGLESNELPVPATFVIGQDAQVVFMYKNENYKERADRMDVIKALDKLASK